MNSLRGVVVSTRRSGGLMRVEVECCGTVVSAYLLDETERGLRAGTPVLLLFKESEAALAKGPIGLLSLRNRFTGHIRRIRMGELLAEVTVQIGDRPVVSIVSRGACEEMALVEGDEVTVLVKANEMTLMEAENG